MLLLIKKRSLVSKNSNSFNARIKRSSVTINNNHFKKTAFIATAIILLSVTATFGFSPNEDVFAKKPQSAMELSNGAPSGPHHNLNILGKKVDFNCDESEGGGVVFTPTFTGAPEVKDIQTISFVSNKKSTNEELFAIDPCTEHFSPIQKDGALVHLPSKFDGQTVTLYEVYMAIKGKPDNGDTTSKFVFSNPRITQACNIVEAGDTILTTDSDFDDPLVNFNLEKHTNIDGDDIFQSNEIVYLDNGSEDGEVDAGDTRLANAQLATDNGGVPLENDSTPMVGDSDFGDPLIAFAANEKFGDVNPTNGAYDIGEAIYLDFEPDGMVSELDTRLFVPEGSEALSCDSADAVTAIGTVTNNGAFVNKEGVLERFTPEDDRDENPQGKLKGKGKSKFVDMSGLFTATGAICDATILDTWDLKDDDLLTLEDFDEFHDDAMINGADLFAVGAAADAGDGDDKILAAEALVPDGSDIGVAGILDTDADFAAFLANEFGVTFNCVAFYFAWVFTIADIVEETLDIDNDGATTVQIRFYPRFT